MTRIFDNIAEGRVIGPELAKSFESMERLDVAVGYFDLRGWRTFQEIVDAKSEQHTKPVTRILVGMVLAGADRQLLDALQADMASSAVNTEVDNSRAKARRDEVIRSLREQLVRGIPKASDRETLQALKRQLDSGAVEIKVHTRRPLHGKTYIFHRQDNTNPITGYVGSSNLTSAGLNRNYELNVDVLDYTAAADLAQWFEDRWNDKFSLKLTSDLVELLEESWASDQRTPYEVFLKVCYHLSRDVREGLAEYSLPPTVRDELLAYQASAVQTLARRIETRGGSMLGDVVGLGKTITAIATALMLYLDQGYTPLVLCPKNLVKMWESYLDAYEIPGRVISYTQAHKELPELRPYRFVICDESHTLRNDTRRDYQAIRKYIEDASSKVLLLTATPYNLRFEDVANQLGLYIGDDQDLGIEPTAALAIDDKMYDKVDGKIRTLAAFRRSEEADDWKRLMSEHLVRRTRSFIRKNYAQTELKEAPDGTGPVEREFLTFSNGHKFYFPERKAIPVNHTFGPKDPAFIMESDDTLDTLQNLILPRYRLFDYLKKGLAYTADEKDFVDRLERGRGQVAGFIRTSLYKRLSSCGHAFILSLKRIVARNELYVYAVTNNLDIPVGTLLENMLISDKDEDIDVEETADTGAMYKHLRAKAPASIEWVASRLFSNTLVSALERDNEDLRELLSSFGAWSPTSDSKMKEILALVTDVHADEKVLIFTEYKDTAEYVGKALSAAGVQNVGVASGDTDDPTALAKRFSPNSNKLPGHEAPETVTDELRVLVATDVLSEGQNLQDAHIVINYDLPWAIIRLIQRAGRVDRVGQESDTVTIYSFFHENVENVLKLRSRISSRLAASAQAFGSDEQFFGSADEIRDLDEVLSGKSDVQESDDDVDSSSLAFEIWSKALTDHPDLAERVIAMPDLVSSTRPPTDEDTAEGVACFVRVGDSMDTFGFGSDLESLRMLTGHEALRVFRSDIDTPTAPERPDHLDLQEALIHGPMALQTVQEGRLRGVRKRLWARLANTFIEANDEAGKALTAVHRSPLTKEAERRFTRAFSEKYSDAEFSDLLVLLHREGRLVLSTQEQSDAIRIVCSMGVAQ